MMEAVQSRSTTTACGEYTPTRTPKTQRERERERERIITTMVSTC